MRKFRYVVCIILILSILFTACQTETPPETSEESTGERFEETAGETLEAEIPTETEHFGPPEGDEKAKEFWTIAEDMISYYLKALMPNGKDWYAEHNGEMLQRVDVEETGIGVAQTSDIVFYRAVVGETLEDVVFHMLAALYEPYLTHEQGRDFTITEIRLDLQKQEILTSEAATDQLISAAWEAWNSGANYSDYADCLYDTIYREYSASGIIPLGENMWILPVIEGYYRYEGVDVYRFDELEEHGGTAAENGLYPFTRQGEAKDFVYLLIKESNIYRLQRLVDMEISIPPYFGAGEEIPDGFRAMANEQIDSYVAKVEATRAQFFSDYNGDKVQTIPAAEFGSPGMSDDIVFYRADEGETLEEIIVKLSDARMEKFLVKNGSSGFVVTDYFLDIEEQVIKTPEELREILMEELWGNWKGGYPGYAPEELLALGRNFWFNGFYLIGEEMWLLPTLNGYYKYEGRTLEGTFEEYLAMYPEKEKNGMMPFALGMGSSYILIKEGDVYRLQNASEVAGMWNFDE